MVIPSGSQAATTYGPWHILLVTDSPVERKLLIGLFSKHAHRVFASGSGRDAVLDWADDRFDVVVLDALLSEADGAEVARKIRNHENGRRSVPIVVLAEHQQDRDRCLQAGADLCLKRPVEVLEFNQRVHALLNKRPDGNHPPSVEPSVAPVDHIDWQVAFDAVGGRRDLLVELVEIFISEYPTILRAIEQAIQQNNAKGLQLSAHQLKGCLRYFGTTAASDLAWRLEDIGRSGDLAGAAERLPELVAAVERIIPLLRQGA